MLDKIFKPRYLIPVILLLVIYIVITNFAGGGPAIEVRKTSPQQVRVVKTVSASGDIKSKQQADLSFEVLGTLYKIYVEKGEFVKKGTLLATLDASQASQNLQAAKDTRDIALRDLELYIEQYNTNPDAVSGRDEYEIGVRRLQELLSKAEASYQASLNGLGSYYIYAPFDGTVVDVLYEEGENITFASPVIKLVNLGTMVFEIDLDQEDFGLLKQGLEVDIVLDSYPNEVIIGQITSLPVYANGGSQDFTVEVELQQSGKLLTGMTGDADIVIESSDGEVQALIFDVILQDSDGSYVWVEQDGKLQKEYVDVGLEGDLYTEIISDLSNFNVIEPDDDLEFEIGTSVKVIE